MCLDPTNTTRELDREWKRLIKFVKVKMPHGTIEITFRDGKPKGTVFPQEGVRFDRPVESPSKT